MRGFVTSVHVADVDAVTRASSQLPIALAPTVLVMKQTFAGAVKLAVKFADSPGARVARVNTVDGEAWVFVTTMSFNVTFPEFRTVPV
jgi:hypothetical protein